MKHHLNTNLQNLSKELNDLYGFVKIKGGNYNEPAINSGPCGPFAKIFYDCWNNKFTKKVNIVFIMVKNDDECWHVLIRLPNGQLFDGGIGIHDENRYGEKFIIEDMLEFDHKLLDKRSYGLEREYPKYCPNFSVDVVTRIVKKHLDRIDESIV